MNDEALKVRELFNSCLAEEKSHAVRDWSPLKKGIFDKIIFEAPLFVTNPDAEMVDGSKYRDLVELLREANDNTTRWLILARWLKQEGICEPVEFLPFSTKRLAKKYLSYLSASDIHHASLVDIWKPYFEALMRDWKAAGGKTSKLKDKGYDHQAIISMSMHEKSIIPSVCDWLEIREQKPNYSSRTLQNAYSRCQPTPRKKGEKSRQ